MAFTVTARHSGTSGASNVQTLATGSATPTANSLLLVFAGLERDLHQVAESWQLPTGGGWTYTQVTATGSYPWTGTPDFNVAAALWRAAVGGSPAAHTITIDAWSGTEDAYYSAVACDITGHNTTSPIVQSAFNGGTKGGGDAETGTVTLSSAPTIGNLVVAGFVAGNDVAGAFTAPTIGGQAMQPLHNLTENFAHSGLWYRIITGAESNAVITCSDLGQSVGAYAAIAVEIAAEGASAINGAGALTSAAATASGTGTVAISGSGAAVSSAGVLAGTGALNEPTINGTGALTAPAAVVSGTGAVTVAGIGAVIAPAAVLSGTSQRFVTGISSNGRYFVDAAGNPILIRGESPWAMFTDLSSSQMDTYLGNRAGYGCNLMLVSMIGAVANGAPADTGATFDGILPFVGGDITNFNEAYWSRMDSYIAKARDLGITLMIYPMDGWNTAFASVVFNPGSVSNAQCQTYGQTLATRYAGEPNIIWAFGGDYNEDATINARFNACLTGIRAAGDTRPASIQLLYETSESHNSAFWETKVDWDWVYTYYVTYKGVSDAYNYTWSQAPTVRPALFCEGAYENSNAPHPGTDEALRRQACWALTSGSPGELSGQEGVWNFLAGWETLLDTTAADQLKAIRDTFEALDWWTLVPDDANQLVTAGRGTRVTTDSATFPSGNNYVTAAKAADGSLAVIYLPNAASAITVDMSKIGPNPTATWVDPTTGGTTSTTPGSSYSRGDNTAGDTDWLLILTGDPLVSNGSGNITAPASTAQATGAVLVAAAGSPQSPAGVLSGTGGVSASGSGQLTAPAATVVSTGTVGDLPITGSGTLTAPAAVVDGAGTVAISGSGAALAPMAVMNGAASVIITGSAVVTAPAAIASGAGNDGVSDPEVTVESFIEPGRFTTVVDAE